MKIKILCIVLVCVLVCATLAACFTLPEIPDNNPDDTPSNPDDGNNQNPDKPSDGDGNGNNGGAQTPAFDFSDSATAQNGSFYKKYSQEEKQLYYTLWQETTSVSVKIDITPYELEKINEAYVDWSNTRNTTKIDTYRKCNLTITVNGTDYFFQDVGIRMRGNSSKREFCNQNGNVYAFVHFRFNLTETFDGEEYAAGSWASEIAETWTDDAERDARKDRSFATMEKFYYKWNKNYDNTYMREVYANRMFRANGVLAPHITMTQLLLKQQGNFENLGVGNLYETIDKQFIKRNFPNDKGGDLYKCTYTNGPADLTNYGSYGVETPTQTFSYSLKTNDDRTSPDYNHHKYFKALVDVLKTSQTAADFSEKLESVVDMNYFAAFEAVNYLLGNPDCIRNNANNYYMYFLPSNGMMYLIPYDYDRCLGINMDWNPTNDGVTSVKPFQTNGAAMETQNPLYRKTILSTGLSKYQNLYREKLQAVLDGQWFTYENFRTLYLAYKSTYENVAAPSQTIVEQCAGNVKAEMLFFSERGSENLYGTSDNVSVERYMQLKRSCALGALN